MTTRLRSSLLGTPAQTTAGLRHMGLHCCRWVASRSCSSSSRRPWHCRAPRGPVAAMQDSGRPARSYSHAHSSWRLLFTRLGARNESCEREDATEEGRGSARCVCVHMTNITKSQSAKLHLVTSQFRDRKSLRTLSLNASSIVALLRVPCSRLNENVSFAHETFRARR